MDKTQLKEWLTDAIEHEEKTQYRDALQTCLDSIDHQMYQTWLAAEILGARHAMVQLVADQCMDYKRVHSLSIYATVLSRVSHKLEGGGK